MFSGISSIENEKEAKIYLTDFKNGRIIILDENYTEVKSKGFEDENLPPRYAPFTIKVAGENIYVGYNKKEEDGARMACIDCGLVNVFDKEGKFVRRLVEGSGLNMPVSLVFAPKVMGYKNVLLVANEGDGKINLYDASTGKYLETLKRGKRDLVIEGLNSIAFGTANGAGSANDLFFTSSHEFKNIYGKIIFPVVTEKDKSNLDERQANDKLLIFENEKKSYEEIIDSLQNGCVVPEGETGYLYCLDERLEKKIFEIEKLQNRILSDLNILQKEFKVNSAGEKFLSHNQENINFLETQNLRSWIVAKTKECHIKLSPNYIGENLEKAVSLCVYDSAENFLKDLYVLRASWVRFYISLGSEIEKPLTAEFQKLRDEEEFRSNNAY
jgi:hypothetical protein